MAACLNVEQTKRSTQPSHDGVPTFDAIKGFGIKKTCFFQLASSGFQSFTNLSDSYKLGYMVAVWQQIGSLVPGRLSV